MRRHYKLEIVSARFSVTRSGEISPLWQKKSAFVTKLGANLVFGTLLNKLKRIFYAIGQICIVVNGQILNKSSGNLVPLLVSASRSGNLFVGRTSTSCSRAAARSTTTSWSCSSWSMRARLLQVFFFCL